MKVKDLLNAIQDCNPEMEVFADVHDGLWEIKKAEVTEWYKDEEFSEENPILAPEKALSLQVACSLPVYMP